MAGITIKLEGDGHERLMQAVDALGKRGRSELKRSLISGGRKTTTQVKKALTEQTSIKKRVIDGRTVDFYAEGEGSMSWTIQVSGTGVQPTDLKSIRSRKGRDRSRQPRDAYGRFGNWPNPGLAKGRVTATVWDKKRTFAYSEQRFGKFKTFWPDKPVHNIFGPAPAEEAVKDQSAQAFHAGLPIIQANLAGRIVKLTGGAFS
ncbi:hypothetical protein L1787_16575 [Acuticoccus sp. M5D2P5]|uniref:hypothetical protein n=1 Tax=Acuticoccus kalidii TaxID=2910977 RepID=UPI001F35E4D8|nr:hypothetical protein [Acuticoccus kalidii]MCF3935021.1 hypothetical protein [Acuticoccus kalidii]